MWHTFLYHRAILMSVGSSDIEKTVIFHKQQNSFSQNFLEWGYWVFPQAGPV